MTKLIGLAAALVMATLPAGAQDFWSNTLPTITGTDTLGTTLRERRASPPPAPRDDCSIDALSDAEKNEIYAEFVEVRRRSGSQAAQEWIGKKARELRTQMTTQGRC
ncbi:hypothetical protein [Sphingomonas xinjiangensis]|uniref:Uncharacterized protein n=1 Tax=Sphingomonas xinjiangensis TaxID=643568 RepID=A0A840YL83_9SPHN|nr:hypothetical protein [Sphingomonas xinjiangensis]MBB5712058.1 hypothetical protein [Sphingomonas xinjiangensis]